MIVYKAYKFKLNPTEEQKVKLNKFLGASRFIYNYYLGKKKEKYELYKKNYSLKDMKYDLKELQEEYKWLKEIDGCILRTTLDDLDNAYTNFLIKQVHIQSLNQEILRIHIVLYVYEVVIKIIIIQI